MLCSIFDEDLMFSIKLIKSINATINLVLTLLRLSQTPRLICGKIPGPGFALKACPIKIKIQYPGDLMGISGSLIMSGQFKIARP